MGTDHTGTLADQYEQVSTIAVMRPGAAHVGSATHLTVTAHRLLWLLLGTCARANYVYGGPGRVARLLGCSYLTALHAWQQVCAEHLVLPAHNQHGRVYCHRLSPALAWKGRPWKAEIALAAVEAEQRLAQWAAQVQGATDELPRASDVGQAPGGGGTIHRGDGFEL